MTRYIRKYWYIIAIVLTAMVFGFNRFSGTFRQSNKNQTSYIVKRQDLKETLTISGKTAASEHVTLQFQTGGRLAWVGVAEGQLVKKYQSLASLDQRDLRNRLNKFLNSYLKTRWDFEQTKDDNHTTADIGLTQEIRDRAKRIMEKAQFDLNNSVLDVELQDLSIQYASLWTPIAGVVTRVDAPFAGVNITPTQAQFEITNPTSVYLSLLADQNEIVKLREGLQAEVVMDSYPQEKITGTIVAISFTPKTGETSTVYEVKLGIPQDNRNFKYRLDMTGDAIFVVKEKNNALSVPASYIKEEGGKNFVMREQKKKKERVFIQTGDEYDEQVEIISGLGDGDVIYD